MVKKLLKKKSYWYDRDVLIIILNIGYFFNYIVFL